MVRSVGPPRCWSYLIGGLLVFLAMRMLGEMAAADRWSARSWRVRPRRPGDWAAYIVGWLYWYFWVGVIAFEAVVGGAISTVGSRSADMAVLGVVAAGVHRDQPGLAAVVR